MLHVNPGYICKKPVTDFIHTQALRVRRDADMDT